MRQLKISKQVTNRESVSLDKYLQDIGKVDLITAEEEVELAQKIREGDQVALDKLTTANLRFVVSVAKQYQNQGLKLPDLINEGNVGLVKAAKKSVDDDITRGKTPCVQPVAHARRILCGLKRWTREHDVPGDGIRAAILLKKGGFCR